MAEPTPFVTQIDDNANLGFQWATDDTAELNWADEVEAEQYVLMPLEEARKILSASVVPVPAPTTHGPPARAHLNRRGTSDQALLHRTKLSHVDSPRPSTRVPHAPTNGSPAAKAAIASRAPAADSNEHDPDDGFQVVTNKKKRSPKKNGAGFAPNRRPLSPNSRSQAGGPRQSQAGGNGPRQSQAGGNGPRQSHAGGNGPRQSHAGGNRTSQGQRFSSSASDGDRSNASRRDPVQIDFVPAPEYSDALKLSDSAKLVYGIIQRNQKYGGITARKIQKIVADIAPAAELALADIGNILYDELLPKKIVIKIGDTGPKWRINVQQVEELLK
jgi:hypothetical protein